VPIGVQNFEPRRNEYQKIIPRSIGSIVRGFKIGVTKWFRNNSDIENIWQRNYHEHIIRDEHSYERISYYILENPNNWENDDFFN
jgi:REP element-mobilizing transposase RayT